MFGVQQEDCSTNAVPGRRNCGRRSSSSWCGEQPVDRSQQTGDVGRRQLTLQLRYRRQLTVVLVTWVIFVHVCLFIYSFYLSEHVPIKQYNAKQRRQYRYGYKLNQVSLTVALIAAKQQTIVVCEMMLTVSYSVNAVRRLCVCVCV